MLNNFDIDDFLTRYWQKEPLLIRNAFPDFCDPLSPEELAGLACEDIVESRLVTNDQAQRHQSQQQWHVRHGPFTEQDFLTLPEHNWTLLVQAVNHWHPGVAEILNEFRFLPAWRLDDIMVSYATANSGVGPHFDYYDVFLIQGLGSRDWKIGQYCSATTPVREDSALKLLTQFDEQQCITLNRGDMLYIPSRLAHWGMGNTNSLSYSVGFRGPSHAEILSHFTDEIASHLNEDQRYQDPVGFIAKNHSEITPAVMNCLQQTVKELLDQPALLADWFGRYMTEPKSAPEGNDKTRRLTGRKLAAKLGTGATLSKAPTSRFAYWRKNEGHKKEGIDLYVDGQSIPCHGSTAALAVLLCEAGQLSQSSLASFLDQPDSLELLTLLISHGALEFN